MTITKMQEICRRAEEEMQTFVSALKAKPVNEVLDAAYELTIRRELLYVIQNAEVEESALMKLSGCEYPLACLYDEWLSNDYSFLDCLRDTVRDYAEKEAYSADMYEMDDSEDLEP